MPADLLTQLRAYGEQLDSGAPVLDPHRLTTSDPGGVRIGERRRVPAWAMAIGAALLVVAAVLASVVLSSPSPEPAVEPDAIPGGVGLIEAYVEARNADDIERVRSLTWPESIPLSSVFGWRGAPMLEWRLTMIEERVSDCGLVSQHARGDTYRCAYRLDDQMATAMGHGDLTGTVEVLVRDGHVAAFTIEVVDQGDVAIDISGIPAVVQSGFGEWLSAVEPELQARAITASLGLGDDDLPELRRELLDAVARFMSLTPAERADIEPNSDWALVETWVNQTGLMRISPALWRDRLDRACDEGAWDHEVARALAAEYVLADAPYSTRGDGSLPTVDEAAQALWLAARNHCPEEFPVSAIEQGPPRPEGG